MEFYLWFWLLDRRYCCIKRPQLKQFSFLFLIPIMIHMFMVSYNLYCLYPFNKTIKAQYIVSFCTALEIISIISLIFLLYIVYKLSKNYQTNQNIDFILFIEEINTNNEIKENKNNFIYYEDYWIGRKALININGILVLALSCVHTIWSFYYVLHRNTFADFFKNEERIPLSYAYFNIFSFIYIISILAYAIFAKIIFLIGSMCWIKCIMNISKICFKKNKGMKKTIDFSDIPDLEPEFI